MNNDDNLDLLDLNDDTESMDNLPDAAPFAAPRPKKPWLLLGLGLLVIILATYIIIRAIGGDSSSTMEVDLDAPAVIVDGEGAAVPVNVGAETMPVNVVAPQPQPQPMPAPVVNEKQPAKVVEKPAPVAPVVQKEPVQEKVGTPVRVVEDRKEVTFNPEKQTVKVEEPRKTTQSTSAQRAKTATKTTTKSTVKTSQNVAKKGSWYVQFGSYSTRAAAEKAQRQIQSAHRNLFNGKQFVILAAVLPNGTTTYRLRIAFASSNEANGFCRNAKSDGLDCYVAK